MKKSIFVVLSAVLLLAIGCKKDDEGLNPIRPAIDAAALYEGTWTINSSDTAFGTHGYMDGIEGTLRIDTVPAGTNPDSTYYFCQISIYRAALPGGDEVWNMSSIANISRRNQDFGFNNNKDANPFGSVFAGNTTDGTKHVTMNFSKLEKVPIIVGGKPKKKNVVNVYVFHGTKVQ